MTLEVRPIVPSPVAAPPLEPTTPIKPSEAIRLGCLLYPVQTFGSIGAGKAACAVRTFVSGGGDYMTIRGPGVPCPACGRAYYTELGSNVVHLNDDHRWSRERIADWLESRGL